MFDEVKIIYLKRILYSSLLVFLFLIPFPHVTALSEISFYLAVLCAAWLFTGRMLTLRVRTPLIIPMLAFALWAALSSLWAADAGNNLLNVYNHLVKMIILYVLLASVFTKPEDFRRIFWILVLSLALYSLWAIVQYYIIFGYSPLKHRLNFGPSMNTNRMGHLCVVVLFLGLSLWREEHTPGRRILLFSALLTIATAMLFIHSRTVIVAMASGLIILAWHHRRTAMVGFTLLAVVVSLLFYISPSIWQKKFNRLMEGKDNRVAIYATFFNMAVEQPLTGYGFSTDLKKHWQRTNDKLPARFHTEKPYLPHNFLLDLAVHLGIVGILLYCWLLVAVARTGCLLARMGATSFLGRQGLGVLAAFTAIYTAGLVGNIFHPVTETLVFTLMALLTILWHQKSAVKSDSTEDKALYEKGLP
ncbi:MAG: O-Antigen ligase [Syntrophus sp. PtaB.Bin001]|nr:MAG: O-Antigen ligase [Syntrophus sp. PtaB.Bin001]